VNNRIKFIGTITVIQSWDTNGDNIKYKINWDWSDSKPNQEYEETEYVPNGTAVEVSHCWNVTETNSFIISVRAIDEHGEESEEQPAEASQFMIITPLTSIQYSEHQFSGNSAEISGSSNYSMKATVGEAVTDIVATSSYTLKSGYEWPVSPEKEVTSWFETPTGRTLVSDVETMTDTQTIVNVIREYTDHVLKDLNGNMLICNNRWIEYDYDNRPIKVVTVDGKVTEYEYDYTGQRVKQIVDDGTNSTKRVYIGTIYEEVYINNVATDTIKYIYAGTQRIALDSTKDGLQYFHGDHLGSTNLITDSSGTVVRTNNYTPYGNSYANSSTGTKDNARKYTGQILDDTSGLYYYNARYYDPMLCQFITPDNTLNLMYNPQGLNRYVYCLNNPIKRFDPTGHAFEGPEEESPKEQYQEGWEPHYLDDGSVFMGSKSNASYLIIAGINQDSTQERYNSIKEFFKAQQKSELYDRIDLVFPYNEDMFGDIINVIKNEYNLDTSCDPYIEHFSDRDYDKIFVFSGGTAVYDKYSDRWTSSESVYRMGAPFSEYYSNQGERNVIKGNMDYVTGFNGIGIGIPFGNGGSTVQGHSFEGYLQYMINKGILK